MFFIDLASYIHVQSILHLLFVSVVRIKCKLDFNPRIIFIIGPIAQMKKMKYFSTF